MKESLLRAHSMDPPGPGNDPSYVGARHLVTEQLPRNQALILSSEH